MKKWVVLILILAVLVLALPYIVHFPLRPSQHVKEGKGGEIPMVDSDDDGLPDIRENYDYGTDYNNPDTDGDGVPDNWEAAHMGLWSNVSQKYEPVDPNVADASDDYDNDGLMNIDEYRYSTDPGNPDTDFDNMSDGWEVKNGLNPLNPDDACDDYDNDNLTNFQEYQHGTNPNKNDSDSDGLNDYDEIFIHSTDPCNPDSDFDGMPDGWEVKNGLNPLMDDACNDDDNDGLTNLDEYMHDTDPNNPDTDGDGMLDGWEVKHGLNPLMDDASNDDDNDNLTNIEEYMNNTFPDNPDSDKDGLNDGNEVLVYGSSPLNPDSDNDNLWDGYNITVENVFHIGELSIGTNPNNPDTDGDMLNDYDEFVLYRTNPNNPDSDNDGLKDGEEVFLTKFFPELMEMYPMEMYPNIKSTDHTDPLNPDTDGDGLLDGEEVKSFTNTYDGSVIVWLTNPLNPDSDGDGIPDGWEAKYAKEIINGFYNIDPRNFDANNDSDNDGLTNIQEYSIGTDPNNPDTDFDGMPDAWEVFYQIFNPATGEWTMDPTEYDADNDIDNDNLTNLQEYSYSMPGGWNVSLKGVWWNGTTPNHWDTDLDGMPDGWELKYSLDPLNPDDATEDPDNDTYVFPNGTFIRWANIDEYRYNITEEWSNETVYVGSKIINKLKNGVWWNGTNPKEWDTDGDGMPDGWGVYYKLNPLVDDAFEDKDGDDLLNLEEYLNGTDPTNPDSDNDGLTDGYEVKTYLLSSTVDWDGDGVIDHYTTPLSPDTDGDSFLDGWSITLNNTTEKALCDYFKNWNIAYVDNKNGTLTFYGELNMGTEPLVPDADADTDGDGLTNWEEVYIYGTDPNDPDTDDDGLWDGEEVKIYGTDPLDPDTDGGGCWDGWEVEHGFDPTNAADDSEDPDMDGLTNRFEFLITGTNPTHPDTDRDRLLDGYNITVDTATRVAEYMLCDYYNGTENITLTITDQGLYLYNYFMSYLIVYVENEDGTVTFIGELSIGTDPTNPDMDGDNHTDGSEWEHGTDPNDNQSYPQPPQYYTAINITNVYPIQDIYYINDTFTVAGWVKNASNGNEFLPNITVKIYLKHKETGELYYIGSGNTNTSGEFNITCKISEGVPGGEYTLVALAVPPHPYQESEDEWGDEWE